MADKQFTGIIETDPGSPEADLFQEVCRLASERIFEAIAKAHQELQAKHGNITMQAVLDGAGFAFAEWGRLYMVACAKAGMAEEAHETWHEITGRARSFGCEQAAKDLSTPLH